jgi:hypothetical protein
MRACQLNRIGTEVVANVQHIEIAVRDSVVKCIPGRGIVVAVIPRARKLSGPLPLAKPKPTD